MPQGRGQHDEGSWLGLGGTGTVLWTGNWTVATDEPRGAGDRGDWRGGRARYLSLDGLGGPAAQTRSTPRKNFVPTQFDAFRRRLLRAPGVRGEPGGTSPSPSPSSPRPPAPQPDFVRNGWLAPNPQRTSARPVAMSQRFGLGLLWRGNSTSDLACGPVGALESEAALAWNAPPGLCRLRSRC